MRIRSVLTHAGEALCEGLLIAMLVVGILAGTALAGGKPGSGGKGGHGGGSTVTGTITVPDGVFARTDVATVTPTGLWVYATCSQSRKQVYAQYVKSDDYGHAMLTLGPTSYWSGGGASCTARAGTFSQSG